MVKRKKEIHPIEGLYPRPLHRLHKEINHLVKGKLWLKVLIGMGLGVLVGFLLGPTVGVVDKHLAKTITEWLALPGSIFLRVIQMIVIPLIFASIIKGIAASESMKQLKRTGLTVALYFLFTTTVAIVIGVALASWIEPGRFVDKQAMEQLVAKEKGTIDTKQFATPSLDELPTAIGGLLPANVFGSMLNGEMLQIVIFAIIFGIALVNIKHKQSKPLLEVLGSLQEVCMTIVKWTMLLAPFAVFGLMTKVTSQFGFSTLIGVGVYVVTVFLGLAALLAFYCCIVFITSRMTPGKFLKAIRDAQLLAFSTSSSAAVMPLSMKVAEEKLKVRPATAQFIIPIGATVNMDGTAIYQAIATIFLAQVFDINLGLTALLLLIITIIGASIGAPATPGVGIGILSVILSSMGIPIAGLALILGVDRLLDMTRTAVNVTGDLTASTMVDKLVKDKTGKSHSQLLKEEQLREKKRQKLNEDVLIVKA